MNTILIVGSYSTALEIKAVVESDYHYNVLLVDKNNADDKLVISEEDLNKYLNNESLYILGITDFLLRKKISSIFQLRNVKKTNIISKKSYFGNNVKLSCGIYIAPNASVSNNVTIKDDCIVNFNSVIGHDVKIGENVIINPGAIIGGNVVIGDNCLIGANSFVRQGITIGNNVKIDAMTHIFRDIDDNKICTGRTLKVFENKGN